MGAKKLPANKCACICARGVGQGDIYMYGSQQFSPLDHALLDTVDEKWSSDLAPRDIDQRGRRLHETQLLRVKNLSMMKCKRYKPPKNTENLQPFSNQSITTVIEKRVTGVRSARDLVTNQVGGGGVEAAAQHHEIAFLKQLWDGVGKGLSWGDGLGCDVGEGKSTNAIIGNNTLWFRAHL